MTQLTSSYIYIFRYQLHQSTLYARVHCDSVLRERHVGMALLPAHPRPPGAAGDVQLGDAHGRPVPDQTYAHDQADPEESDRHGQRKHVFGFVLHATFLGETFHFGVFMRKTQ